ncbi:hypothetical protein TNCV_511901 [Trichonephila clavipes]|nr:hypothetical protein TNCV_511901 [Trichonephila clavipes]
MIYRVIGLFKHIRLLGGALLSLEMPQRNNRRQCKQLQDFEKWRICGGDQTTGSIRYLSLRRIRRLYKAGQFEERVLGSPLFILDAIGRLDDFALTLLPKTHLDGTQLRDFNASCIAYSIKSSGAIYQQDNAHSYTCTTLNNFFKYKIIPWACQVTKTLSNSVNTGELTAQLQISWHGVLQYIIDDLIDSMSYRISACIYEGVDFVPNAL